MQFHIAMTTYNRTDVLEASLESLANTETSEKHFLYIFDDLSTDKKVKSLIENFIAKTGNKFDVRFSVNDSRLGCDPNMCKSIRHAFTVSGSKFVITTDSDVIYNRYWLQVMEIAYLEMEKNDKIGAISLYDSWVHGAGDSYNSVFNKKKSVGGLCALLNREIFLNIKEIKSWDWSFVHLCQEREYLLLCVKMSMAQHIGAQGEHSLGNVLYDFSKTFRGQEIFPDFLKK